MPVKMIYFTQIFR